MTWSQWLKNRRWSDDVLQETALRLIERGHSECPLPLAQVIARNLYTDQLRRTIVRDQVARHADEIKRAGEARPEPRSLPVLTRLEQETADKILSRQPLDNADYIRLSRLRKRCS